MSADLLAEFGTNIHQHQDSPAVNTTSISQAESTDSFFDDEFDSFVSPEPAVDTHDLGFDEDITKHETPTIGAEYAFNVDPLPPVTQGSEVLFDASTEARSTEDDDWGTFETAETAPSGPLLDIGDDSQEFAIPIQSPGQQASKISASMDLLALEDKPSSHSSASQITPSKRHLKPPKKTIPSQKAPAKIQTRSASFEDDFFGEWDSFEDGSAGKTDSATATSRSTKPTATTSPTKGFENSVNKTRNLSQSETIVRPTNIPPPSVLLQIFPSLFDDAREKLNDSKRRPTASTSVLIFNLSCTLKVASRIIAGRALRWKRDTILSQSMKIGPAQSGKNSGMKLSSVSKGESIKEEQETVGLIDNWRHHASVFNSLLQSSGERPVPVVTDKTRVITASPQQGAIKAAHACALCGLKRDERLPKVDDDAQDSFGDWWVEHWGHTDCKWFWEENSFHLQQR